LNDQYLRIALKNSARLRLLSLILFFWVREIRSMMGERRVMQEALFYGSVWSGTSPTVT
jgi:hypothetical protein